MSQICFLFYLLAHGVAGDDLIIWVLIDFLVSGFCIPVMTDAHIWVINQICRTFVFQCLCFCTFPTNKYLV